MSRLLLCLGIIVLGGCHHRSTRLKQRQAHSVQRAQSFVQNESPIVHRYGVEIAAALHSTTLRSLAKPRFATAAIAKDLKGYELEVFWLADDPSADSIEVHFPRTGTSVIVPISPSDREWNNKSATSNVVFAASHRWETNSELHARLDQSFVGDRLSVRLIGHDRLLTRDWYPVSVIDAETTQPANRN